MQDPLQEKTSQEQTSSQAGGDAGGGGGEALSQEELQERIDALKSRLADLFAEDPRRDGLRILEVGCGIGVAGSLLMRHLKESDRRASFYAMDLDPGSVAQADRRFKNDHERLGGEGLDGRPCAFVGDFFQLPFPDASFDFLVAFNIFYWVDKQPFLRELSRVLAEDGRVLIYDRLRLEKRFPRITFLMDQAKLQQFLKK